MKLDLDSRIGGLGDVWMRLTALQALVALRPEVSATICVPPALRDISARVFGDRFEVRAEPAPGALIYSHLGLVDTGREMLAGRRFISPFFYTLSRNRKPRSLKERINFGLNRVVAATGALRLPSPGTTDLYHGLMQLSFFQPFDEVPWDDFVAQAKRDLPVLRGRLRELFPVRSERPLLVFPSGSGHQVMPAAWAKRRWPDALYAFHSRDEFAAEYAAQGLRLAKFDEASGLLELAARAARIVATDSFPSHVMQTYTERAVIALTQHAAVRVVSPAFDGVVIDSPAPCCPCLNLGRHVPCEAGRAACLNWEDERYVEKLIGAVG